MALADPITIAAAAPTPQLVFGRTRFDGYGSERIDTGGNGYSLLINHTPTKGTSATRHYIKIDKKVDAVDPYSAGLTKAVVASVSLSVSRPRFGFTDAAMIALVQALIDTILDSEVTTARLLQLQS